MSIKFFVDQSSVLFNQTVKSTEILFNLLINHHDHVFQYTNQSILKPFVV
jgi:hypothetical protein